MKKFIITIIIYILILGVLTVCIDQTFQHINNSDSDYTKKFGTIQGNLEICNFGSSHGLYGYNYRNLENNYKCFNFALTSQSLSYDYRLMQYYQDKLADGCIVFINVSYFSLIGNSEVREDDFASKNKRYYKILPPELIKEYDAITDFFVSKLPSLSAGVDLIKAFTGQLSNNNDWTWSQTADSTDVQREVADVYERHIVKNKIDSEGKWILNQEEMDALYAMIELCNEKGWVPIIITTPFLTDYTDTVKEKSPKFSGFFYGLIDQIVEDTDVEYYDYSLDERFQNDYTLFMDGDHLNKEGAQVFVDILYKEIIQNHLIK